MSNENKFTEMELEAFAEMGNIGAGHAAIALTSLLNREVDMSAPFVRKGKSKEILKLISLESDDLVAHEVVEIEEPIKYKL